MTLVLEEADLTLYSAKCLECDATIQRLKEKLASNYYFCGKDCANKWRRSLATILTDGEA